VEYIRELCGLDAHSNGDLQAQPSAVHIRLDLVSLLGEVKIRLRGHEECRQVIKTVLLL
jgi:hypothetical protein